MTTPCKGGGHALQVIMCKTVDAVIDEVSVVRWCANCGAIVVDAEVDGRIHAGRHAKMRFPAIKKAKAVEPTDAQVLNWSERHDIRGSLGNPRMIVDDARTLENSSSNAAIDAAIRAGRKGGL